MMLKKLLLLPAAATTLFAILNLYFVFLYNEGSLAWRLAQGLASLFVIGVGLWTWFYVRTDTPSETIALLAGSGLILLGLVGAALAYSKGQATGDFEYYLLLADALFVGQGVSTIFITWWDQNTLQRT